MKTTMYTNLKSAILLSATTTFLLFIAISIIFSHAIFAQAKLIQQQSLSPALQRTVEDGAVVPIQKAASTKMHIQKSKSITDAIFKQIHSDIAKQNNQTDTFIAKPFDIQIRTILH